MRHAGKTGVRAFQELKLRGLLHCYWFLDTVFGSEGIFARFQNHLQSRNMELPTDPKVVPSSLAGLPACRRSFPVKSLSHPTPSKDIRLSLPTFKDTTLRFTSRSLKCKIMRNLLKFTSFFQNGSQWHFGESPDLPTIPPTLRNYIKTSAAKISALALHVAGEVHRFSKGSNQRVVFKSRSKSKEQPGQDFQNWVATCQQTSLRASQTHRARTSEAPNPKHWPLCTSESLRNALMTCPLFSGYLC